MIRHSLAIALGLCLAPGLVSGADKPAKPDPAADPRRSGGATTVFDTSRNAFSLPAKNLGIMRRDSFFIGNAFFKQPWVVAPASTSARDGLGPMFNTNTCQGCHVKDGRGQPPISKDDTFLSALVRLSVPAISAEHQQLLLTAGAVPEPNYGDQLQPKAVPGVKPEATPRLRYHEVSGQFADGEKYTLVQPELYFENLNYGELHKDVLTSVRVAPAMIGLGLLEAMTEADILQHADPDDKNDDGISGRPNQVWDVGQQKTVLGRFGWKANQPTVLQQSEGAFNGDMGITSVTFPNHNCSASQQDCQQAPHGGEPEISAEIMQKVAFYASTLAVPARRNTQDKTVLQGEKLFHGAGCASCHVSEYTTGQAAGFPELSDQLIRPYTDLLLHDMGEGLADGRPDFLASGREWRTPPLWGIGLVETVNGHTRFLHDGRARNLLEAVLWHGGEAEAAKQQVL
ncbi:MAG: Probable thiol oxidoreductase with 2 cytochrome c heme-binding sites, partial [uncultured Thiotrichaceae bacterium]